MDTGSIGELRVRFDWINRSNGDQRVSDSNLVDLVNDWVSNPNEDMEICAEYGLVQHSSLDTPPAKITYSVGETIDPSGLVIEVRDGDPGTWSVDLAYDAPEHGRLYSCELLDASHNHIDGDTVTADTRYCRFHYMSIYEDVEINLQAPHTFKFAIDTLYHAWYNQENGPTEIEFSSANLVTNPVTIPTVYIQESGTEGGTALIDVGWQKSTGVDRIWTSDEQLVELVNAWSQNATEDVLIYANFGDVGSEELGTAPTITSYNIGEEFNPSGFVMRASAYDGSWHKNIPYDKPEYQRIYNVELYDSSDQVIAGNIITADTAYAKYIFNRSSSDIDVPLTVTEPAPPTPPTPPTPPAPAPTPEPYNPGGESSSGGSSSGGSSSASVGPMGDLTKNPIYQQQMQQSGQLNSRNNIPQNNLIADTQLAVTLLSVPENANIPKSNIVDVNGNTGFGKWGKVPGTNTWYFLTGDITNGTIGTSGFVSNGLYNLSWGTLSGWYSFDAKGVMQTGWQNVNGKRYYFESNPNSAEFGKAAVGSKMIDGQVYNFDANGELL